MLRKAFQQGDVEIDWDLQLPLVRVRNLTRAEPEISLLLFCRGGRQMAQPGPVRPNQVGTTVLWLALLLLC